MSVEDQQQLTFDGIPDTYAGYLEKKGKQKNGSWRKRYFALRGHHLLCFQDSEPGRPVLASIDAVKVEVCGPVRRRRVFSRLSLFVFRAGSKRYGRHI